MAKETSWSLKVIMKSYLGARGTGDIVASEGNHYYLKWGMHRPKLYILYYLPIFSLPSEKKRALRHVWDESPAISLIHWRPHGWVY